MLTASEVAHIIGVDREVARGFVRFLHDKGLVVDRGRRKISQGPGRGEDVYDFPPDLGERLARLLAPLRGR